ncbi:DUF2254 domain-containing protein [Halomonas kalidii]|uniref:DUF2254 family protein n=1 Tax=Halomonas kalidii TaxID=3043293 RepID=A0ABT6VPI1_9GAMM|nr:DUF2254 family protein [Halomonas kalidii]MDI5934656.1 DUF2254 family protein [Halomonas kalidii]
MTVPLSLLLNAIKRFRHSIAFLPTQLVSLYLMLAMVAVAPALQEVGLPTFLEVVRFRETDTVRTLLAALTGGMFSMVVFGFTMVMSVLTQAGGNFSHKLVFGLISERHHQWVLGHYLGTILFILLLLMIPEDSESPGIWRSLTVQLAVGMVIHCLGLFVFFIHNASQSVQINSITRSLHRATTAALHRSRENRKTHHWRRLPEGDEASNGGIIIRARCSGYIQNADLDKLATLARQRNELALLQFRFGEYTLEGMPLIRLMGETAPDDDWVDEALDTFVYLDGESIEDQPIHGLTELMEVAVKALSPGINAPGTARLCLHQMTDLLRQRLASEPCNAWVDADGVARVRWPVETFESLLYRLLTPILHYGREDVSIDLALLQLLKRLSPYAGHDELRLLQRHAERVLEVLDEVCRHPLDRAFVESRLLEGEHRLTLPTRLASSP